MAGHSPFVRAKPNQGHKALFELVCTRIVHHPNTDDAKHEINASSQEELGLIGVRLNSCSSFDDLTPSCGDGLKDDTISIVTQNVDMLHAKAGTRHCLHLHGRGDLVSCQSCGFSMERTMYHHQLIASNRDWYEKARYVTMDASKLRPDGDADLDGQVVYDELFLPACPRCSNYKSFFKTSVVFFGDQVPKHRFDLSYAAVDACDGVLCVGTSLAVHSAFRLTKRALHQNTPVCILNVGETRVEREGWQNSDLLTKIESPIGRTLSAFMDTLDE